MALHLVRSTLNEMLSSPWISHQSKPNDALVSGMCQHNTSQSGDFGIKNGRVWVRGPWEEIQPSQNIDDVIDQLCPAIMKLPRAQRGDYGQEYCGVIYSRGEGIYYSSKPSPLGEMQLSAQSKRKSCHSPRYVVDDRGRPSPIADFHSHPWSPSAMSMEDRLAENQRWLIRIQFDTACHLQKLVPNLGVSSPGEVYERRGQGWTLLGYILPEDKEIGRITLVEESP